MTMMTAQDVVGLYAIIPTPAKPGSEKLTATDTVDLAETERLINALIRDGSSGLIVLGTTGECATLSDPDYKAFVGCVIDTVNRRIPTFVGATTLGGHETARRLRLIGDLGADGVLLGLPMWQPVTTPMAVDYYAAVSEAFPDLAVMVYANARAFRYTFPQDFWAAVVKAAPTVMSAKYSRPDGLVDLIAATGKRVNFIPSDMAADQFYALSPETTTACWATSAGMNPLPALALMQAIAKRDAAAIGELAAAIAWANEPVMPIINQPEVFAHYNIQLEKTRINAAGYCDSGPTRPPYENYPAEFAEMSRECGRRWARVCAAYKGDFQFQERPWRAMAS